MKARVRHDQGFVEGKKNWMGFCLYLLKEGVAESKVQLFVTNQLENHQKSYDEINSFVDNIWNSN